MVRTEVLVIGGGIAGLGIARDLAMRGIKTILVERKDFAAGASGGNHGMLHSGARYAVRDPGAAAECAAESKVLGHVADFCINDCGGLFVSLEGADATYEEQLIRCTRTLGIESVVLNKTECLELEPRLGSAVLRGLRVRDAGVDPFALAMANVDSARRAGATLLNYRYVDSIARSRKEVGEVIIRDTMTEEAEKVKAEVVVNAAGAWATGVASLAKVNVSLTLDKGSMIVLDGRFSHGLVNHLRPPGDGDIVVPSHSSSIIGTTSVPAHSPDITSTSEDEVVKLIGEAARMIPEIRAARAVRAYARVRSLVPSEDGGRRTSRDFRLIDHESEGVNNLVTIFGGKLTTYRLMAERTADLVARKLGNRDLCRTAIEPLRAHLFMKAPPGITAFHAERMVRKYGPLAEQVMETCVHSPRGTEIACSCEQVLRGELEHFSEEPDVRRLGDLGRRTRAGQGFCQSGGCAFALASALMDNVEEEPMAMIRGFLEERGKGVQPVLAQGQLRQAVFKSYLLQGTYGLEGDK